jgi:hypothetical protein
MTFPPRRTQRTRRFLLNVQDFASVSSVFSVVRICPNMLLFRRI